MCSVPPYCQHSRYKGILKSVRFQFEFGKRKRTKEGILAGSRSLYPGEQGGIPTSDHDHIRSESELTGTDTRA